MHGTDVLNVSTELADAAWVSVQTTGTVGRGCRPDRSGRASDAGEIGPAGATERPAGVASGSVGWVGRVDGQVVWDRTGGVEGGSVWILRGDA